MSRILLTVQSVLFFVHDWMEAVKISLAAEVHLFDKKTPYYQVCHSSLACGARTCFTYCVCLCDIAV